ncbi:MAG: helix-turn-helix domain-containing protein [Spirochaetaceae bacterium]|nr:MAG: helix-turn-helix domain-containing protein [Spirochaetaceae bacterium]
MAVGSRVRKRWFLSFLGVTAFPFVIGIFLFLRGEQLIRTETDRVHQAQLSVLIHGLDSVFKEIRTLEVSLIQDRDLHALISGGLATSDEYLTARRLISRYGASPLDASSAVEWMVYVRATNKVLTPTTYTYDANFLLRDLYGEPPWMLAQWRLQMRSTANRTLGTSGPAGWNAPPWEPVLVYRRHLPIGRSENAGAVAVFSVSTPLVSDLLRTMLTRPDDVVFLWDGAQSVAIGKNGVVAGLELPDSFPDVPTTIAMGYNRYTIYRDQSRQMPVQVVYALAEHGAFAVIRGHRTLGIVALLVCVFLAAGLSGYFVIRNYTPVRRLLELVIRSSGSPIRLDSDEFRIIEDTLNRAMSETDELRALVHGQEQSLELYKFRSLLRGATSDSGRSASDFFRHAGVEQYVVMLIDPVRLEQAAAIESVVRSVIEEPLKVVDLVMMGNGLCLVVGSPSESYRSELAAAANSVHGAVRSRVDPGFAVAASPVHDTTASPRQAIVGAQSALDYRIVEGTDDVLRPNLTRMPRETFEFTLQQENDLANTIIAGDFETANLITSEILDANFEQRSLSIEMGRCLAFSLGSMFIRTLNRVARFRENHIWDELKPIDRIVSCLTSEQLRMTIRDLLLAVCTDIRQNSRSHSEVLVTQITEYIAEKLSDHNLGTKQIADRFDMNPAYLARVFKDLTGHSFSEYINRRRIEIGKEKLRSSQRTIADIGQEVGYPESSSFTRFFKKFEGMTPGFYRDENRATHSARAE